MAMRFATSAGLLTVSAAMMLELHEHKAEENATAKKKTGTCDCMSFAEVYATGKAWCGRANELYFLSKNGFSASYAATEPITGLPHKVCYDFFKNWLTPKCVNVDLYPFPEDSMSGKQWCYVSNDCPELNGGGYATNAEGFAQSSWHNLQSASFQAWKICDPADGDSLATMPVPEVIALGEYSDVPMSRMLRLAYPAVNISWGEAKFLMEAVNDNYSPTATIASMVDAVPAVGTYWGTSISKAHATLREIIKSEQGTVLDSVGHGDNFHVIQGRAAYSVNRIALGNMAYLGGHFFKEYTVSCVIGCAQAESRHEIDLDTM